MRTFSIFLFFLAGLLVPSVGAAQTPDQIRELQSLLVRTDRSPGPIDGVWGRKTEAALVDFLAERGMVFDGEVSENELALLRAAPEGPAYVRQEMNLRNTLANVLRDNRDQPESEPAKIYDSWDIPEYVDPNPNLKTLRYYLRKQLNDAHGFRHITVQPDGPPSPFEFRVEESRYLTANMAHTALLSYLYYEDGAVIYDEITPKDRFGDIIDDARRLRSNSVGKSMTSYLLGHAICAGYVNGLDARLDDWPLISETVYENQRLIDLVNMRAGDERVVSDTKGMIATGRWYNIYSIGSFAREELTGTEPKGREGSRPYHYNGLTTNIVLNYVLFKSGANIDALLNRIFVEKAGIEHEVFFFENRGHPPDDGAAWYMFYASRYDYLRIARAMLEDWQNDTCVGQYLKEVYNRSQSKNRGGDPWEKFQSGRAYGGYFHTRYAGMADRAVLGMDGYGGQAILIDFDNARIVSAFAAHIDYDWYGLIHQVIQNGRLP
jgi:peptidoglycan hydrolase-like protein with peptidoglycan-binding domain